MTNGTLVYLSVSAISFLAEAIYWIDGDKERINKSVISGNYLTILPVEVAVKFLGTVIDSNELIAAANAVNQPQLTK
ncbi:MAG: hypothetical protein HRU38_10940 [Saccharospirillaceae bacterium]|nr:hypothetical protein [Saccharospirillaceae bacterium]